MPASRLAADTWEQPASAAGDQKVAANANEAIAALQVQARHAGVCDRAAIIRGDLGCPIGFETSVYA
jgi:hypothetical protein